MTYILVFRLISVSAIFMTTVTSVSSTNKTDRHDITEILLKVALNTITLTLCSWQEQDYKQLSTFGWKVCNGRNLDCQRQTNKEDIISIGSKNIASQRTTYCTVTHSELLEVVPFFIHDALVSWLPVPKATPSCELNCLPQPKEVPFLHFWRIVPQFNKSN